MGYFVSRIRHSIIALFNDPERGNWLYIHSTSDSISSAKSCMCHCKSLGTIIFLLFVIPTEASKYSTLALPNWFTTSSEVYTLNCHNKHLVLFSFFHPLKSGQLNSLTEISDQLCRLIFCNRAIDLQLVRTKCLGREQT